MFICVVLKPIDGFKLRELICTLPVSLGVVFTMQERNDLIELIEADGCGRCIVKPVMTSKISSLAGNMVEAGLSDEAECKVCPHFRFGRRKDKIEV